MSTQAITIADNKKNVLAIIQGEKFKAQLAASLMARLPEDYVIRTAVSAINSDPKIQECTPISIAASILLLAQAGLAPEPWKGHGWLIPRNKKIKEQGKPDRWIKVCTALLGYRGLVTLASRSPQVVKTGSYPVFEGDIFELDLGSGLPPIHKPWVRPTEESKQRGAFIGAWAFAKFRNEEYLIEWMTKEDIDKIKGRSEAASSGPWVTDYVEMARKTPFRRLFKWIPDPELQKIAALDEANELGRTESFVDQETGEIVTVLHEESDEPKPPIQQPQRVITGDAGAVSTEEQKTEFTGAAVTTDEGNGQPVQDDAAAAPSSIAEQANPFKQEQAALATEPVATGAEPDPYHKKDNPNGAHISVMQHKRLFGILHSAQEMVKNGGKGKAPSDEELRQYVMSKGWTDERFIPCQPREPYEQACSFAGGDQIKVSNGGQ